ncbi:S1/P1 nuclease [Novosphingobium sp. 9U]|uniref:S1/P1 nuclease n=1 Tax=Novosphingobium sp. 9U TaxID=2653158 RepID=UPI0012F46360|nr:S1/P1 nuclease [Novosphingobium sp. 9U]VWX49685.1 S1/P1 Nuclease [Novosphingobium sp. 9U]
MIRRLALLLAALAGLWAAPALAWGAYGHRTVAAIALDNVKPATRARIAVLLRDDRELGTPKCRVRSLEDAAVWPDCIKGEQWRWAYTSPWHYQDEPVCGAFDIKSDCANGNCVTAQIERNRRILTDRTLPHTQRLEALIFVTHFVGDIHQPLHGADSHDQGGNLVKSSYGIVPGKNLHSIWDTVMTERAISSARPTLVRQYDAAERTRMQTGTPEDWLRESWQIARDFLYPQAFGGTVPCATGGKGEEPRQVTWPEPAIEASLPVVQQRIEQAGLRLARMLDEALA